MRIPAAAALTVVVISCLVHASGDDAALSEAFYQAIRANDLSAVDRLIANGGNVNARSDQGVTPLMDAAAFGSVDAMARLLAAGAMVDARNALGSTALTWSVREPAKVRLLLDRGADVNASSALGRTPLLVAAASDGSAEIVAALIARGADVRAADRIGMTALHAAAYGNDTETVRLLLDRDLNVNAKDSANFTPLMTAAANGNVDVVKMLLAHGARADAASGLGDVKTHTAGQVKHGRLALSGFTPIHLAAVKGPLPIVKALADAGADINAIEGRGMTPLMLAVAADHASLEIVTFLLDRGGNPNIRSAAGETALDWALKFGATPIVAALKQRGAIATTIGVPSIPAAAPADPERTLARSMSLLEKTSGEFAARGGCAACHAQNIMDVAGAAARLRGLPVDEQQAAGRIAATRARYFSSISHLLERQDTAGTPDLPLYSMLAFANAGYAPDRMTDAIAVNVAAQQLRTGRWHFGGQARPPIEEGDITRTALAIRALDIYAPPSRADIAAQIAKAREWLQNEASSTSEDRNFRLLGLTWAGAGRGVLDLAAADILSKQRADGGWAQRDELTSDAYATGQTLYALAAAGTPTSDMPFRRGIAFLQLSQRADGSWFVRSRAPRFQPYFESGFPYGADQWISAMATGWAASALALSMR